MLFSQGEFDVQSQLPNVVPDPASLELGSEYFCEPGKVVFGDQCGKYLCQYSSCLECLLGTIYDKDGSKRFHNIGRNYGLQLFLDIVYLHILS